MPFERRPEPTPVRRGEDVFAEEYRRAVDQAWEARMSERLTRAVTLHDGHGGLPRVATFRSLKDNANG